MTEQITNNSIWENDNPAKILQDIRKLKNSREEPAAKELKTAQAAYQNSIHKMVDALKEMEGEEITTAMLMEEVFGPYGSREFFDELFDVHRDVWEAAGKAGLILDMSKHENKCEGLPFNLDYLVRMN